MEKETPLNLKKNNDSPTPSDENTPAPPTSEEPVASPEQNATEQSPSIHTNIDVATIRKEFDDILVKHVRRLMEIESLSASLSFNLSTISCLLLLVERENEIKDAKNATVKRYTRESFLDDLNGLGITIDDDLMVSFQALAQNGYVEIDSDNRYNAQISAFAVVSFIDNLFPGMRGINFVAYVLQMIDEVCTERKGLKDAVDSFDSALFAKGISLSQQKIHDEEKDRVRKDTKKTSGRILETGRDSTKISDDLKQEYSNRLSRMRSKLDGKKKQTYISVTDRWKSNSAVKELFPKGPTKEEIKAAELAARQKAEQEEAAARKAEQMRAEIAEREAKLKAKEAEIKAAEIAAREAEIKAREAELKMREADLDPQKSAENALPEPPPAPSEQMETSPPHTPEPTMPETDVEARIKAFEQSMAPPCPICGNGKITAQSTEKDQQYYACTNDTCAFISWSKPHNYPCPLCKNPFLIEFTDYRGQGLKCHRSTCSYWQSYIGAPADQTEPAPTAPKKRRKVIRRRKK